MIRDLKKRVRPYRGHAWSSSEAPLVMRRKGVALVES